MLKVDSKAFANKAHLDKTAFLALFLLPVTQLLFEIRMNKLLKFNSVAL